MTAIPFLMPLLISGNLHVAGGEANRVNVFCPEGKFVRGYECGLTKVTGVAVDWSGYSICVGGASLTIYSPDEDSVIHTMEGFTSLSDVGVSSNGSIWVVDTEANKVSKVAMHFININ